VAAAELARVARPGATVAFTCWTPEGITGRFFNARSAYMPPLPPELESPLLWGEEEHVRSLFEGTGAELSFERRTVAFTGDSPDAWVEYQAGALGPLVMARAALEQEGTWQQLRADLVELYSEANEAADGSFRAPAEYLLSVARMPV